MLKDPFYYGVFEFGGERYEGCHEPAVSKALFDQAQVRMKNRGKAKKPRRKEFAFTGLLTCKECGHAITAEVQKGHTYYHCTKRSRTIRCTQPFIREEALIQEFEEILAGVMLPESWAEPMLAELEKEASQENSRLGGQRDELDEELSKIQTKVSRLADLFIEGDISRAEYRARKASLVDQKAALLEKIRDLDRHGNNLRFERMREPLTLVRERNILNAGGDLKKLRGIISQVGSNLELNTRKVLLDWASPYVTLATRGSYSSWRRGRDSNPRYGITRTTH